MKARHNETGKWGEQLAVDRLVADGWTIRERNWRVGHDELDIVAIRDGVVAFVEVKTRTGKDIDPLLAIDRRKMSRIIRSARAYMTVNNLPHSPRFDVFGICGTPEDYEIEYIPDAFYPPLRRY